MIPQVNRIMADQALRLEAVALSRRFGSLAAVENISLQVRAGEVIGLIGPNGAGKTTLFNLLSGVLAPDAGRLRFHGEDVTGLAPYHLARRGLVRTFQLARELDRLTVLENVLLAAPHNRGESLVGALFWPGRTRAHERRLIDGARHVLETTGLLAQEALPAAALSGGQKKLLELARCLMSGADTIMLDEVAAGVAPHFVDEIGALITNLNRTSGKTFIVIEHNVGLIRSIASRVIVLSAGQVIADGPFAEVASQRRVIESYLGQAA